MIIILLLPSLTIINSGFSNIANDNSLLPLFSSLKTDAIADEIPLADNGSKQKGWQHTIMFTGISGHFISLFSWTSQIPSDRLSTLSSILWSLDLIKQVLLGKHFVEKFKNTINFRLAFTKKKHITRGVYNLRTTYCIRLYSFQHTCSAPRNHTNDTVPCHLQNPWHRREIMVNLFRSRLGLVQATSGWEFVHLTSSISTQRDV